MSVCLRMIALVQLKPKLHVAMHFDAIRTRAHNDYIFRGARSLSLSVFKHGGSNSSNRVAHQASAVL